MSALYRLERPSPWPRPLRRRSMFLGSISTAISAAQRGAPIKVLAVTLHRPLFWLVARPEFKNISDLKGKVLGVVSIGGAQHGALRYMLRKGGINPDSDVTTILAGDVPTQLQSLASNAIQAAARTTTYRYSRSGPF